MSDHVEKERYAPAVIEPKWQKRWDAEHPFEAVRHAGRPKMYVLDMFPYPSGSGLHVGHPEGYTATDIVCRFKRMRGFDVLHPMGWDAFGLPAEQYAIQTGTHPRETTLANIATFKRQLKSLGFSYDWSREVDTTDAAYVKWTQWIFLQLYKRGLAFQAEVAVNWCAGLGTVLANEEVIDGKSERGNFPVERLPLRQWMLRITEYADRLDEDLATLDWPDTKGKQHHWIGRSEGAIVAFGLEGARAGEAIRVFTTRVDTLAGATYVVVAPEHPLALALATPAQRAEVAAYVEAAKAKTDIDRSDATKTKTGVATGAFAVNPANGDRVPVWVGDYVIGTYGTGAVMAVPAHDERDHAFARVYGLPIVQVIAPTDGHVIDVQKEAFTDDGVVCHQRTKREIADGTTSEAARAQMTAWLVAQRNGGREGHLPAARLGVLAPALLGGADPDLLPGRPRERHDRPADERCEVHDSSRSADRSRRVGAAAAAAGPRGLQARDRSGGAARARSGLALLPAGREVVRAGDEHDAAMGGVVLVLPPLPRSEERQGSVQREVVRRLDARRPLRWRLGARRAPPLVRALLAQGALRHRRR